jgi:ligand-binding SRPBCC domain-containing protein
MKIYAFHSTHFIPANLDRCWDFFSSPSNLSKITPPEMGFVVKSELPDTSYPGQIIVYTVKPLLGIPVTWVTEITQLREKKLFIDEQRFGPYKFWHHQHAFREVPGGVEMTDLVHYAMPFGIFGRIALPIVKKKIREIFDYRSRVIEKVFGS